MKLVVGGLIAERWLVVLTVSAIALVLDSRDLPGYVVGLIVGGFGLWIILTSDDEPSDAEVDAEVDGWFRKERT